jgi:hypothetical protein
MAFHLSGHTRDNIAADNDIGAGTVSDIVTEWRKGIDEVEYESVRELSIYYRKQGINLGALTSSVRLDNYINKLGASHEHIELLISFIIKSQEPQRLLDLTNQMARLSISDSVPLDKINDYINQQKEEMQRLERKIEKADALLEEKNIAIQTIEEYKKLKEELNSHGLHLEDSSVLLSILQAIREMGYDPRKIVSELRRFKLLRQSEKRLKENCKELSSRAARYKQMLPICEQILRLRIGLPELMAMHTIAIKKANSENLPEETAIYHVMEDIEDYERIGGLKNQISNLVMQKHSIAQICAPREKAIISLMRLQSLGVADTEILYVCEWLKNMREKSLITQ